MKQPQSTVIWCVLIVCFALLIFTYLTRKSLCEIRLKDGATEGKFPCGEQGSAALHLLHRLPIYPSVTR
ncbi:Hok/Gef family protein [Enterobacter roggenkampii]|nr:Hok/Gef family protein [Enterobacter roggenkampii]